MDKTLEKLIWLSNVVGKDKDLAVGTGGNTSGKTDDMSAMFIKASGSALSEVSKDRGWRKVSVPAVLNLMLDQPLLEMSATDREVAMAQKLVEVCIDNLGDDPRPSVESTLHAFMGKYGVHLHALPSLAYVCAKNGEQVIQKLFKGNMSKPLWIPYSNPGFDLGVTVKKHYDKYLEENSKPPKVMFFEKHGMMVCSDDAERTFELTKEAVKICQENLGTIAEQIKNEPPQELINNIKNAIGQAYEKINDKSVDVHFFINPVIELYFDDDQARELISQGPLTPDEIGFVESPVLIDETQIGNLENILADAKNKKGKLSNIIFVEGIGLFVTGHKKFVDIVKEVFSSSLYVRYFASKMGGLNVLTDQQQEFVKQWEGEKYRVKRACQT